MNIRITPFSYIASPGNSPIKKSTTYGRDNPSLKKSDYSSPGIPVKKPGATAGYNFHIISKKRINKPQLPLKVTSNIVQQPNITGKKGILLYQQIERERTVPGNTELTNRFHFKT